MRRGQREDGARPTKLARLARKLRDGDPGVEAQVRARVRRIIASRQFRVPPGERPDLEQEVMIQLWQTVSRAGFEGDDRFWGLVEVISARRMIDWLRSSQSDEPLLDPVPDSGPLPSQQLLSDERAGLVRRALSRLDPSCQELIRLRVGERRSYREIAATLGDSESALRVRMHRCIRRAREELAELLRRPHRGPLVRGDGR